MSVEQVITEVGCESGDWHGAYLNGQLIVDSQGHPGSNPLMWAVLAALGVTHRSREVTDVFMEDEGLPDLLDDIPEEAWT